MENLTEKEIDIIMDAIDAWTDKKGLKQAQKDGIPKLLRKVLPEEAQKDFDKFVEEENMKMLQRTEDSVFIKAKLIKMKREINFKKLESL